MLYPIKPSFGAVANVKAKFKENELLPTPGFPVMRVCPEWR